MRELVIIEAADGSEGCRLGFLFFEKTKFALEGTTCLIPDKQQQSDPCKAKT